MDHKLYRKLITIIESYPVWDKKAFNALINLMNRTLSADEQAYWLFRGRFTDSPAITKKYFLLERKVEA